MGKVVGRDEDGGRSRLEKAAMLDIGNLLWDIGSQYQ